MSFFISVRLFLYVLPEGFCHIDACLIRQEDNPPWHPQVHRLNLCFITLPEGLIAVFSGDDSCHFTDLFGQTAMFVNSLKYRTQYFLIHESTICCLPLLSLFHPSYSLFCESINMVTGPSFSSSTFMSAPNVSVCTSFPKSHFIAEFSRFIEWQFPVWALI